VLLSATNEGYLKMKFTQEDLQVLNNHQVLLIINFSVMASYCNKDWNGVLNCYTEGVNLLEQAKIKLSLSDKDVAFLYNFFLENDHY